MERLIITGIEQVVGANLALTLSRRFDVLGLFAELPIMIEGCEVQSTPEVSSGDFAARIANLSPDWVVHCGCLARSSWDAASTFDEATEMLQIEGLVEVVQQRETRLALISTDAIFCGPRMFHPEDAPATAAGQIARFAREAERFVLDCGGLVARTHAYGWSPTGTEGSYAEQMWDALSSGHEYEVDTARHATPILASDLADRLATAFESGLAGVYHISGTERTNPHRFADELAAVRGWSADVSETVFPISTNRDQSRPLIESSLSTRKARRELQTSMPLLRDGLERFHLQAQDGYRERLRGRQHRAVSRPRAA